MGAKGSWASSPATRAVMLANRSRDTGPELALRSALHARGLRYRVDSQPSPTVRTRADVVFTRAKVAVFVDGCYWHGCPTHATVPKTNTDYWVEKVRRNQQRDRQVTAALAAVGWTVLRFWEHEDTAAAAQTVDRTVRRSLRTVTRR